MGLPPPITKTFHSCDEAKNKMAFMAVQNDPGVNEIVFAVMSYFMDPINDTIDRDSRPVDRFSEYNAKYPPISIQSIRSV